MHKAFVLAMTAFLLGGCASDNGGAPLVQARTALHELSVACEASNALRTHLEKAKCINDAVRDTTYVYAVNKDLLEQSLALREVFAAKVDRHELTIEEAKLQFAQANSQLDQEGIARQQQKQAISNQRTANALAVIGAMNQMNPQPYQLPQPVYTPLGQPRPPINCTSTPMGQTVYTNCY